MKAISRRTFLKQAGLGAAAITMMPHELAHAAGSSKYALTPAREIEGRVRAARPLLGGKIPADFANRLGTTHYDGHYFLTQKPYLIEGAEKIHELGMNVAKFWLREDKLPGYGYNSDWQIPLDSKLVDVLQHKYYEEALAQRLLALIEQRRETSQSASHAPESETPNSTNEDKDLDKAA